MRSRYTSLLFVAALALVVLQWANGQTRPGNRVIAVVNGELVRYSDVVVAPDADVLLARFRRAHGRDPETETDKQAIRLAARERESVNLANQIRGIVRRQQIERFGIEPTEQEVEERWKFARQTQHIDQQTAVLRVRNVLREVIAGLEEVIDQGRDPEEVYQRRLADKISREEWKLRIQYQGKPQKRESLKRAFALPDEKLFNPRESYRWILTSEKLTDAIDQELVATDPEFAEYMRLLRTDPGNERVRSKDRNYVAAKRYEWWQQRYREAKVEIQDKGFEDAWKEPFGNR